MPQLPRTARHNVATYGVAILFSVILTVYFHELWRANLEVPFAYGVNDELTVAVGAKSLIENPWVFYNPRLGMPFGSTMYDYPQPDVFHYAVMKLLALTTSQFGVVMNVFYLLSFPLVTLTSCYVLGRLGVSNVTAVATSLLYTFLPYHFQRGEAHLFLAAYYMVPLAALLMFELASAEPPLLHASPGTARFQIDWKSGRSIGIIAICVIAGASGVYYAFFDCLLLLALAFTLTVTRRSVRPTVSGLLLTALIAGTVLLCLTPHLLLGKKNVAARATSDAETYALKITQLLLPISGHRVPALAAFKNNYYHSAPLVNENDSSALGIVGAFGVMLLFGVAAQRLVNRRSFPSDRNAVPHIGIAAFLTLVAILFATMGGFSSLFALLVSSQIRSTNRVSVSIAFFALLAVALLLDQLFFRDNRARRRLLGYAAVATLTILGLLDQTSPIFVPNYPSLAGAYYSDKAFVNKVEAILPRGAMVFQLPYMTYPDASEYDHARGYIHSQHLRWSYGAMINRRSDLWQREVQMQPVAEMVRNLRAMNFSGIYLDRRLFGAKLADFELQLSELIGPPAVVSPTSQLAFFDLRRRPAD